MVSIHIRSVIDLLHFLCIPVNVLAIVILSRGKCGLSRCITIYLVGMAAADLLVVIAEPILYRVVDFYFPDSFMFITPVCSIVYFLVFTATVVSVWLTVGFTFDRFVAICCKELKTKYCTEKTASRLIGTVSLLGFLVSLPWYFRHEPEYIIDNVPWHCITKTSFFTSTVWAGFVIFYVILTPCVPFFLILLLNLLTVRRILLASRIRRALRGQTNAENERDPEMEHRRKSIVLLFSISGSFILLWMMQVVFYIYRRIAQIHSYSVKDPLYFTDSTANMLQLLSSCTNTCIYTVIQAKFRQEVKNAVKYPFNLLAKLCKS
ncbi:probable G-protein coupled receptor 139 [Scyliorhinus canicula]|uniref:probable G-protein coupled receptor 139 n=1 Tax=Scyliorhinus canicula TaxID=7830 RepID=UPI0018F6322A|nr:probable G-protein coupled receptor 139 [Scyliorhinus canicula]